MEENIKDFDRSIEQAMNEYTATPPFGMWNRISSELGAAPAPVTPVVSSLLPKSTIIALATVAVLETGFLVNYIMDRQQNNIPQTTTAFVPAATEQQPVQTAPAIAEKQTAVVIEKEEPVLSTAKKIASTSVKPVATKQNNKAEQVTTASRKELAANLEISVPQVPVTPSINNANAADPYYFPPVDINTPESKVAAETTHTTVPVADKSENSTDKKAKVTSYNDKKIRFKPKKRPSFNYGKINRRK